MSILNALSAAHLQALTNTSNKFDENIKTTVVKATWCEFTVCDSFKTAARKCRNFLNKRNEKRETNSDRPYGMVTTTVTLGGFMSLLVGRLVDGLSDSFLGYSL